jgi:ribosomal protein S27E
MPIQHRKDAAHVSLRCGQERRPRFGRWSLPVPPARAVTFLPDHRIVEQHYPAFTAHLAAQGAVLPCYVQREFEDYLTCGRLEHGFLRVRCDTCHAENLVAFSCKRRGFCPSCGTRRMAESAALLVDDVLPEQPMRQWVLSFPYPLRFLFTTQPAIMGQLLGIVYRIIATLLVKTAGLTHETARTGAVTLIQRFGNALNLNIHFHRLFLDGVYIVLPGGSAWFRRVKAPTHQELTQLAHTIALRVGRFLERQGLLERDFLYPAAWLLLFALLMAFGLAGAPTPGT